MTDSCTLFLKLLITQQVLQVIGQRRQKLQYELIDLAGDPVLLKRRYRMLRQLAMYESQILDRIYDFEFQSVNDYHDSYNLILAEINWVSSRNA